MLPRYKQSRNYTQIAKIVQTQLLYELLMQCLCTEREMESVQFRWDTTTVLSHTALVHSARSSLY